MNLKEVGELRRRFRLEKNAISRIYGCFVNSNREIVSDLDESLGTMPQEEAEKYLGLLKKALSGTLGKNLVDIVFSTQQVADSEEHRLLTALRDSGLKDGEARRAFYQKVIQNLDMEEGSYLLLLAHDVYDVPRRGRDDALLEDGSDTAFSYLVCCVCPVKEGKIQLGYFPGENEFHNCAVGQIVSPPELGFLFPAFDDRAANLYNALYYTRKPENLHQEFIDAVFHIEPPMSAAEQREAFETALRDGLEEDCCLEVVQALHSYLRDKLQEHRDSRDPEPLSITAGDLSAVLLDFGLPQGRVEAFRDRCAQFFGGDTALSPANLVDSGRFQLKTAEAAVTVDPDHSYQLETRTIHGRTYLLLPVSGDVELNGFPVHVSQPEEA